MWMENGDDQAIVIDNGSFSIKAGWAGDEAPRYTFRTLYGREQNRNFAIFGMGREWYVGDDVRSGQLITQPIQNGVVVNWDQMEQVWHHTFYNELRVAPEDQPLLVSEHVGSKANREKMMMIVYETFCVPAFAAVPDTYLALFANGLDTGCVLDLGGGKSKCTAYSNGYSIGQSHMGNGIYGDMLRDHLMDLFNERGLMLSNNISDRGYMDEIMKRTCFVNLNENDTVNSANFELPDGRVIETQDERTRIPEILFKPSLIGREDDFGITEMVYHSIMNCGYELREQLFNNIIISGGISKFPNLEQRLANELTALAPVGTNINVVAPDEREFTTWIGGSICASLSTFENLWITKEEYDEDGPERIHHSFFF